MTTTVDDVELKVFSVREARAWTHQWATSMVSLVNERADAVARPAHMPDARHLILEFEDVTSPRFGSPPTRGHIASLVRFGRDLEHGERCLLHCRGGIGRSTAGALCILVARGHTVEDSLLRVGEIRPAMQPNSLMMLLLDEELSAGGTIFHSFHSWAYGQPWWTARELAPDPALTPAQIRAGLLTQTHRRRLR